MAPVPEAMPHPQPSYCAGERHPGVRDTGSPGCAGTLPLRQAGGPWRSLSLRGHPRRGSRAKGAGHLYPGPSSRRGLDWHKNPNTSAGTGNPRTPRRRPQPLFSSTVRSGGRQEGLSRDHGATQTALPSAHISTQAHGRLDGLDRTWINSSRGIRPLLGRRE